MARPERPGADVVRQFTVPDLAKLDRDTFHELVKQSAKGNSPSWLRSALIGICIRAGEGELLPAVSLERDYYAELIRACDDARDIELLLGHFLNAGHKLTLSLARTLTEELFRKKVHYQALLNLEQLVLSHGVQLDDHLVSKFYILRQKVAKRPSSSDPSAWNMPLP